MSSSAVQRTKSSSSDDKEDAALAGKVIPLASPSEKPEAEHIEEIFKPHIEYTEKEEKQIVRKLDWRLVPLMTFVYLFCFIDRSAVGNAAVAGLLTDLNLQGNKYNVSLSIFYIFYILIQIPSNLALKKFGAHIWIPFLTFSFGVVCMSTAFTKDFAGFTVARVFLGIVEGGVLPGISYYLSTFYTRDELMFRIGFFISAAVMSGAFGGLLATGILHIHNIGWLTRWRNIFLIEGFVPIATAAICVFFRLIPKDADSARFLTERERVIAGERMREQSAGLTKAEGTRWDLIGRGINLHNLLCAVGYFCANLSVQGLALFTPTLLRSSLGYSPIRSQLMSVPPNVVGTAVTIILSYFSTKYQLRSPFILACCPIGISGFAMLTWSKSNKVKYAGIFLANMATSPLGPFFLTWGANNSAPFVVKSVATGLISGLGSFGPIVASWSYLSQDAPLYRTGNIINVATQCLSAIVAFTLIFYIIAENRLRTAGKRDGRLDALESLPEEEKKRALETMGHRNPAFRYKL